MLIGLFVVIALLSPGGQLHAAPVGRATAQAPAETVVAVIPPDSPPTYFRDEPTGDPAGFAVDVMNAVAARSGLRVKYLFEDGWTDIIDMLKSGKADLAPGMGVSKEREKDLAFSSLIDAFPISFFVRSEHAGIDGSPGVHTVGVIKGSVAFEMLKARPDIRLATYEGFPEGLFDLLAGKIEAFACPAPTLWQLARETGVDEHIKIVDRPISEITRAIAVRKGDTALLARINAAVQGYVGTPAYQQAYAKWYGKPVPYWTKRKTITAGISIVLVVVAIMAGWRYFSLLRLNRELTRAMEDLRESEGKYHALIESANDAVLVHLVDQDFRPGLFTEVNDIACKRYGYSREEFLQLTPQSINDPASYSSHIARTLGELRTTGSAVFETVHLARDGRHIPVEVSARVVQVKGVRHMMALARDITARREAEETIRFDQDRLESLVKISQQRSENTQELLDYALEEAIRLTKSKIGYIYLYNEERREFTLNTWSREVMKECTIAEPQTIYKLEKTGIWGEAVRQRRPIVVQDFHAPDPLKKGYPAGHAPLHRFLTVPVFQGDRIVAVVGVANKERPYDSTDVNQLTLLMGSVWRLVERKEIETELKRNEAVLRSFLNAVTESALLIDRSGLVLAANETFAKRLGSTVAEIAGRCIHDLLPPDVAERRKVHLDGVFQSGVPDRFEDDRQGRTIDSSVYPVFDTRGAVTAIAIIGIDITERKRAVAALEVSEKKYRALYDSAIDAIFIMNMDGSFIDINRTAYARLGYAREEMLGMHVSRLDPPDYAAQVGERIDRLRRQGSLIFESAHLRKDGTIMPVEINARIIDYDGRQAIFSIVRDITERKTAQQEREKLIAELQHALAEIKTLHGILPICASCKKIRDDKGAWHQMEVYIRDHTDAEFSHGLCVDCAKKLYPEYSRKLDEQT